jgi:hypothetical protein
MKDWLIALSIVSLLAVGGFLLCGPGTSPVQITLDSIFADPTPMPGGSGF